MSEATRQPGRPPSSGLCPLGADPAVKEIIDYYLEVRRGEVQSQTLQTYCKECRRYIVGPLLTGSVRDRYVYTRYATIREGAQLLDLLGPVKLSELTTVSIRHWHRLLSSHVSSRIARVAKKHLRSALSLAAEDFELRVPVMPTHRGRGAPKRIKRILSPAEVGRLLDAAMADEVKGIYYAFPFLTGARSSEQLALQWKDVDLQAGIIRIRRAQLIKGGVVEFTKTQASTREIPIAPMLRTMLLRWRDVCPFADHLDQRVFPCLGFLSRSRDNKRGTPLSYANFSGTYWRPVFRALGLPYVTPHSARHAFISTLQASGIEIGVVAKLAGHADPAVTLSHYTQPVRDGSGALLALETAYTRSTMLSDSAASAATVRSAPGDRDHADRNTYPRQAYPLVGRRVGSGG